MCSLLSRSTPRTNVIQLAIFVLRIFEYKSSNTTDTVNEEESKGTGILNEFKKSLTGRMIIELVSATTDGSTGITGSKALLPIIISKHSVEI